ncbi:hypothetical protein JR338_09925 [Chloroflexota bacterium]|nr:hypothetical protein JR338_09925 [Chloroflexota bacterium]
MTYIQLRLPLALKEDFVAALLDGKLSAEQTDEVKFSLIQRSREGAGTETRPYGKSI